MHQQAPAVAQPLGAQRVPGDLLVGEVRVSNAGDAIERLESIAAGRVIAKCQRIAFRIRGRRQAMLAIIPVGRSCGERVPKGAGHTLHFAEAICSRRNVGNLRDLILRVGDVLGWPRVL